MVREVVLNVMVVGRAAPDAGVGVGTGKHFSSVNVNVNVIWETTMWKLVRLSNRILVLCT